MIDQIILGDENINPIFEEIKGLINSSRDRVYSTVNTEMLNLYWNIGKIIMEIQNGNEFESYIANLKLQHLQAQFVAGYAEIPNKNLQVFSMFGNNETKAIDVDYDRIVFDTYDYLDKIIGFK